MHRLDALLYITAQFVGGAFGVVVARLLIGPQLASPSVRYVVTVPGQYGNPLAFLAEFFMGLLTMTVVLQSSNRPRLSRITWLIGHAADYTTLKSSSGCGGFCSSIYRFHTSSVTLPLVATQYPRAHKCWPQYRFRRRAYSLNSL